MKLLKIFVALWICSQAAVSVADVHLANIFGNNMVLQRDSAIQFWGTTDPNDPVEIRLQNQTVSTSADANGNWRATLKPIGLGAPFDVIIKGSHNEIKLTNVVAGDIWICSGQSNMEWTVKNSGNPEVERKAANYPLIRHVKINNTIGAKPLKDVPNSGWKVCSPDTASQFTAVGYYFGRHLHRELNVPIGLINSSWGGTICEAWASADALKTHPDFRPIIEKYESISDEEIESADQKHKSYGKAFWNAFSTIDQRPMQGTDIDDSEWKLMPVPGHWEQHGVSNFDGVAWYRRRFEIPKEWVGKDLKLSLGTIDDFDATFVNGAKVGETKSHSKKREYNIPAKSISGTSVLIAIRVADTGSAGGIYGDPKALKLGPAGNQTLNLSGDWRFQKDSAFSELPPRPPRPTFSGPNTPTALYNAMIHPLIPFAFKGAIWYQGESNAGRGKQYQSLFPLMIQDWRNRWGIDFPFYWVQLANFTKANDKPGPSNWAEIREAQSMALSLANSGQAVTIDIGNATDIHPKNKQEVGLRLALNAMAKTYGKTDMVYSGPVYRGMKVEGSKIRLSFEHTDGGLVAKDGKLRRFEIAGADKKFVWAAATIQGTEVIVSADGILEPVAVRYAWADNPDGCNLYNGANLPASPFRTDVAK